MASSRCSAGEPVSLGPEAEDKPLVKRDGRSAINTPPPAAWIESGCKFVLVVHVMAITSGSEPINSSKGYSNTLKKKDPDVSVRRVKTRRTQRNAKAKEMHRGSKLEM